MYLLIFFLKLTLYGFTGIESVPRKRKSRSNSKCNNGKIKRIPVDRITEDNPVVKETKIYDVYFEPQSSDVNEKIKSYTNNILRYNACSSRFDGLQHYIKKIVKKRRCAGLYCKKKTSAVRTQCGKCNVGLCVLCFEHYHTQM